MKAKTQINIGIVTALILIALSILAVHSKLNMDLYYARRAFAEKANHREAQKRYQDKLREYEESIEKEKISSITAPPIFEEDTVTSTTVMEIREEFMKEAEEKISYLSVMFQKSNIGRFLFLLVLVMFVFTAHQRYFWLNSVLLLFIGLEFGARIVLMGRSPEFDYLLRETSTGRFIPAVSFGVLLLLLAQSMFGILRLQEKKKA